MGSVTLTQEGIQSMKGALFTMVAENFFPPMYGIMDHIPSQMPVFYREYSNNINSPLVFYLSNLLSLVRKKFPTLLISLRQFLRNILRALEKKFQVIYNHVGGKKLKIKMFFKNIILLL